MQRSDGNRPDHALAPGGAGESLKRQALRRLVGLGPQALRNASDILRQTEVADTTVEDNCLIVADVLMELADAIRQEQRGE